MSNQATTEKEIKTHVARVTVDHLIAYPGRDGILLDGRGNPLGAWWAVSSWRLNSWMGSVTYRIEARVNGAVYSGWGGGVGLIFRRERKR